MLRCADRAEDFSTPTASFHSVCDAQSVHMSDADCAELIHIIAEPSDDAEVVCWDVTHAELADCAAPNVCESKCKLQVDDAPLQKTQTLFQHANRLLEQLTETTLQLRHCLQISKQKIDDVLACPHVNDHDTRLNRERVPS